MFGSLRVRLPLVFLAGILLAGLVTAGIALRLFDRFAHDQTVSRLTGEANGIAALYGQAIDQSYGGLQKRAPTFAATNLERATGDKIYWVGPVNVFPGQRSGLRQLPFKTIDWTSGTSLTFQFTPPGSKRVYLAVAGPVKLKGKGVSGTVGAIVVATAKTDVGRQVNSLLERLALAGLLGIVVAGVLSIYLTRRVVKPVLELSHAADEVAAGRYGVAVPTNAPGELGHLSERFGEMAQRLAEVETMERHFLMSVSHELRTPLTAIRGHVAALLEGVIEDPDMAVASLETVQVEAARLERLVGDILDLAKLDTNRFTVTSEEVDMGWLVDQAYDTFREEARRRSIDYRHEAGVRPVILSDGDRVLQIVGNLLSNAFKATPDGGRITLELAQDNGTVRVTVGDTGPGIAIEKQERLFRPFVSESGGGTGLGLAIAKELSTALGGRIVVDSQLGRGSRFELFLPLGLTP